MTKPEVDANEAWTVGRVARWASEDFARRGIESARLEADLLLGDVLGLDRVRLLLAAERELSPDELTRCRSLFQRRRAGEPIAYILGRREFYGRTFHVDQRVLVPRPETELLVEVALRRTAHRHLDGRALDLCTGSGCVGVTFARERPTWRVTLTDVDPKALAVARDNALRLGAVWGLAFVESDLFDSLPSDRRFELIASNPPYIPRGEIAELAPTVRDFEPSLALDGGTDGLDFYRRITERAEQHLVRGGILALEVGAGQAANVSSLLERAGFSGLERAVDYGGHERVVSGKLG